MPAATDLKSNDGGDSRRRRIALINLGIMLLVTLGTRLSQVSRVEIEHFDEGVYASNLWFGDDRDARYPDRHLYAPPLLPALSEYCQLLITQKVAGATLPVWVLSLVSVWLFLRLSVDWLGFVAGSGLPMFLIWSPLHLNYSASLMTDVPMTACLIGAVWLGWRGLSEKSFGYSLAAGVVCGLGWSFKYSGWLPLAIVGSALGARTVFHVKRFGQPWRELACWGVMVVAAVVTWLPAWFDLQSEGRGGYAAVSTNHARYFEGFAGWGERFAQQIANANWYESNVARPFVAILLIFSLLLAWGPRCIPSMAFQGEESSWKSRRRRLLWAVVLTSPLLLVLAIPETTLPLLVAAAVVGVSLRVGEALVHSRDANFTLERAYSSWMLAAWLGSMLLTTPFYYPYPRLLLPLLIAVWLGSGALLERLIVFVGQHLTPDRVPLRSLPALGRGPSVIAVVLGVATVAAIPWPEPPPAWSAPRGQDDRTGLASATVELVQLADTVASTGNVAYVGYIWGEPAVFYQLNRLGPENALFGPITDFGFVETSGDQTDIPILLVTGPHAERDSTFQEKWPTVRDRFELVGEIEYAPSNMVLLDEYPPSELAKLKERPKQVLKLYRLMSEP